MNRRQFTQTAALTAASMMINGVPAAARPKKQLLIACQHYTWFSYLRREGKEWEKDLESSFSAFKSSGLEGYEPSFQSTEHVRSLQEKLGQEGIWASSMYVNSLLHEEDKKDQSMAEVLTIARAAKKMGIRIVVTNPSPIQWGQPIDKDDQQLKIQAKALDQLGAELRKLGLILAYHNHDMEMRQSAREFHHMMLQTDPKNVSLCLDAHWVYRGAGNSEIALFDIVKLYADRIVELHLRQSQDGIWSEVFGEGDIDYAWLVDELMAKKLRPHLVLEQAVEEGTPQTMKPEIAIRKSLDYTLKVFSPFKK